MAFCRRCGNQLTENAMFCGKCGTAVNVQGAAPQQGMPAGQFQQGGMEPEQSVYGNVNQGYGAQQFSSSKYYYATDSLTAMSQFTSRRKMFAALIIFSIYLVIASFIPTIQFSMSADFLGESLSETTMGSLLDVTDSGGSSGHYALPVFPLALQVILAAAAIISILLPLLKKSRYGMNYFIVPVVSGVYSVIYIIACTGAAISMMNDSFGGRMMGELGFGIIYIGMSFWGVMMLIGGLIVALLSLILSRQFK